MGHHPIHQESAAPHPSDSRRSAYHRSSSNRCQFKIITKGVSAGSLARHRASTRSSAGGDTATTARHRRRLSRQHRSNQTRGIRRFKRSMPGEHLVEHQPKRKDVAARIGFLTLQLFRRHVLHGADDGAFLSLRLGAGLLDCRRLNAASRFASPKSSSFTPDFVCGILAGFRSRCTMPLRCAASSTSAICAAIFSGLIDWKGSLNLRAIDELHPGISEAGYPYCPYGRCPDPWSCTE
jgi:hypothetical protein